MKIDINKKVYEFKFGVKFIRELDKQMPITQDGVDFGLALSGKVLPELQNGNISTLARVLEIANLTEKTKISDGQLDDYIDDHEDIEKLFDDVMKALADSNAGKLAMKGFKERLAQAEKAKKELEEN